MPAVIGAYPAERHAPQRLRIDLAMDADTSAVAAVDDVAATIDYQVVAARVAEFVGDSRFYLVETLANRLAARLLDEFAIAGLALTVTKPDIMAPDVGITIRRSAPSRG